MAGDPDKVRSPHVDILLPYLYNALDEEIGILIRIDPKDRQKVVNGLYDARSTAQDPTLEELIILQPTADTVYIAKKATELQDA